MAEYLVAVFLIFAFRFVIFKTQHLENESKKWYLIFSLLPITLISGFRGESVGADTNSYRLMFMRIAEGSSVQNIGERIEPGYILLNKLLAIIWDNPQVIIIVTAIFISFCIGHFIYRYSKEPLLALLFFITLGLFQFTLSGVRQTIALGFVILSYDLVIKRRLVPFLILLIISATFHKTALLFIPSYFIANNLITTKNLLWYIPVLILSIVFVESISESVTLMFGYEYGIESTGNGVIFFLIVLLITLIGFIKHQRLTELDERNVAFLNINYLSLLLWSLRLVTRTAERISLYFMPSTYLILEEYLVTINNRSSKRIIYFTVCCLCLILFLYRLTNNSTLTPYEFTDFK